MADIILFLVIPVAALYVWYLVDTRLIPSIKEKINDKRESKQD